MNMMNDVGESFWEIIFWDGQSQSNLEISLGLNYFVA